MATPSIARLRAAWRALAHYTVPLERGAVSPYAAPWRTRVAVSPGIWFVATLERVDAEPAAVTAALSARLEDGSSLTIARVRLDAAARRTLKARLDAVAGATVVLELALDDVLAQTAVAVDTPVLVRRRPARDLVLRLYQAWRRHGIGVVGRGRTLAREAATDERERYATWIAANEPGPTELEAQRHAAPRRGPLVSVVLEPRGGPVPAEETTASLEAQIHPAWEVVAAADDAHGDYVAFVSAGDMLAPDALSRAVELLKADAATAAAYSDEDIVHADGTRVQPFFKPDWSPDYLLSFAYTGRLAVYRCAAVAAAGGFPGDGDGADDYALMLRLAATGARVAHIPRILYHRRADAPPPDGEAERRALEAHLRESGTDASCKPGPAARLHRVRYAIPARPLVSIVIATAGTTRTVEGRRLNLFANCVRSLTTATAYEAWEAVVVTDETLPPVAAAALEALGDRGRRVVDDEPFNWSRRMNLGAAASAGDHILFLNDDVEVMDEDWLDALLELSQLERVGAVGAKLHFPNGDIQHAGIVLPRCVPLHVFYGRAGDHPGHFWSLLAHCNYSAVTGACLMTRADVFADVGGFDPGFPLNYNDVDYCLRVRERELDVVYTPYARLRHFESRSRSPAVEPNELARLQERWGEKLHVDQFYNRNLWQATPWYELPP